MWIIAGFFVKKSRVIPINTNLLTKIDMYYMLRVQYKLWIKREKSKKLLKKIPIAIKNTIYSF